MKEYVATYSIATRTTCMWKTQGEFMKTGFGGLAALVMSTTAMVANAGDDAAMDEDAADDAQFEGDPSTERPEVEEPTDAAETTPAAGTGAGSSEAGGDGGRFRFGVAGGGGPLSTDGLDMTYYGVDLRFGWQFDDAIAVYAQPQLGYYQLDGASALFGSGGLVGASIVADYTLFDHLFVGAGLGYAILNNPSGSEVHLRAGGYPLVSRSDEKVRRKALMLGIDFRMHFVEGYTFVAPTFNIGYESF